MLGRRWLVSLALAAAALMAVTDAQAQRTVTIIVPTPAGGPIDRAARLVAQHLQAKLGQPVIVDNRVGAAGKIGVQAALRAARDGGTLLAVSPSITSVNPVIDKAAGYDPLKDFDPLAIVATNSGVLAVRAELPVADLAALVAYGRANPGKLSYASFGVGTSLHLQSEEFFGAIGVSALHVPYKGESQAVTALAAGEVDVMVYVTSPIVAFVRSGRVRALAATAARRWDMLPAVPTYAESGVPALRDYTYHSWTGLVLPAGVPPGPRGILVEALRQVLSDPALRDALVAQGFEPAVPDAETMRSTIAAELKRNQQVLATGRVRLD